ncbi:MAG: DUF1800 family protein, partial [Pseudomonadota bacterium]
NDFLIIRTPGKGPIQAAARFLRQATFGANSADILKVRKQGYNAWIDEQFAKPSVSHLATVKADTKLIASPWAVTQPSIWKQYIEGDDQLRQRVSYALSQIFVVSQNNNTVGDAPCGLAQYLDVLNAGAFGNVRDLMMNVTLSPVMGEYLSMKESAKADPLLSTQPDENYAREVMQLFSIGLIMLNTDGSIKLDGNNNPIPTYTEDTVKEFARVFSGWTFAGQNQADPWKWLYPDLWHSDAAIRSQKSCAAWSTPMVPWVTSFRNSIDKGFISGPAHDMYEKTLLVYDGAPNTILPSANFNHAPTDAELAQFVRDDLNKAIDNIFNHPNVGPFLAKQLIQRLVTSNPTAQYIQRVALKFNDNGSGVRGDMKAVIKAILLDDEARSANTAKQPNYGKLTEPVIRFTQMHRAFNARRAGGYYDLWDFSNATALNQNPLKAPSVFNFYHADYTPAGPLASANLDGPEFEITNASSVAGFADFSKWGIIGGFDHGSSTVANRMIPDYSFYTSIADSATKLVDELDLLLCSGSINPTFKAALVTSVGKIAVRANTSGDPTRNAKDRLERVNMALWLIINSPDYSVQK